MTDLMLLLIRNLNPLPRDHTDVFTSNFNIDHWIIRDMQGAVLDRGKFFLSQNSFRINRNLAPGMYVVELRNEYQCMIRKLIIH